MTSAGQLTVGARFDGRTIREIAVNLHRPSVSRLFIGQLPDVVIKTVPYLFTLCAHAQRAAAVAAVNVALGETLREPAHRELWIEVLHENLWRLLLDWPVALGLSPAKDDFIAWRALRQGEGAVAGTRELVRGPLQTLAVACLARLEATAGHAQPLAPAVLAPDAWLDYWQGKQAEMPPLPQPVSVTAVYRTRLAEVEAALAALDAKRTADEGRHVTLSVARQEAQAEQASRQQQIFLGGQAIARLEQQQLHQSELGRDWQARRQALGERIDGLKAQLAGQLEQLSDSTLQGEVASARLEQCEQLLTDQQSVRAAAGDRLEQARQRQQQWQQQLGQLQGRLNQTRAEVNGLQELQAKTRLARLKLEDEQAGPLGGEGENLQPALDALAAELSLSRARHEEADAAWQAGVSRHEELKAEQGRQQGLLRELEARLATLDQILGEQMAGATLADRLQVPPEWARGLDKVLGRWLTAIPADECNLAQPGLWIGPAQPARAGTLAAQLGGEHIPAFLNAIWLAESREEALSRLHSLSAGESLLTPAGDWFGPNWADLGEGMALGTLALLGERERLHTELAAGREALHRLDEQLVAADAARAQQHGAHELAQRTLREQEQRWQQLREAWSLREGQRQERLQRLGQLGEELARLDKEQAEEAQRLASAGERLEQDEAALGELQEQGEVLAEALLLAQEQVSGRSGRWKRCAFAGSSSRRPASGCNWSSRTSASSSRCASRSWPVSAWSWRNSRSQGPLRVRICRPCWSNSAILRRSNWPVTSGSRSWIVS